MRNETSKVGYGWMQWQAIAFVDVWRGVVV